MWSNESQGFSYENSQERSFAAAQDDMGQIRVRGFSYENSPLCSSLMLISFLLHYASEVINWELQRASLVNSGREPRSIRYSVATCSYWTMSSGNYLRFSGKLMI
jgi:hypothetical protein